MYKVHPYSVAYTAIRKYMLSIYALSTIASMYALRIRAIAQSSAGCTMLGKRHNRHRSYHNHRQQSGNYSF